MSMQFEGRGPDLTNAVPKHSINSNASALNAMIRPMLAGAQARGMADMLEMLELGAILLRSDGSVLYASDRAKRMIANRINLVSGHLAGKTPQARAALDRIFDNVLSGKESREVIASSDGAVEFRALLPVQPEFSSAQLLYSVIVVRQLGR